MTFRWRLAAAMASLSAVAIGVCAVSAYAVTDRHIAGEVDLSLQQAAAEIARAGPAVTGVQATSGTEPGNPPPGQTAGAPPARPRPAPPPPARAQLGVLALVVIQRLDASGDLVGQGGAVQLPVTAAVRRSAADGGSPFIVTATADGQAYRIETVPIPGGGAFELGRDLNENEGLLVTLRWLFALVGLIVIVLAAAAGWLVAGRITRRLAELTDSAEEVAKTGQLRLSVDATGDDEVGRLARSFGQMMEGLARSRAQQQALAQNAEHELRTPLTSMRTNIDLLKRYGDLPTEAKASVLRDLDGELEELTSLVNELVELASDRQEAGPPRPVHLAQLARRVGERAAARAGRAVTVDATESVVEGNARDLERAMANLVDNAMKFSPDGSPVELVVRGGTVEVLDRGDGVSESDAVHLFDRFYRAESARSAPGSGLGLAIVRRVAELHGGTVFAERRDGGGARIGFTVPEATDAGGAPRS